MYIYIHRKVWRQVEGHMHMIDYLSRRRSNKSTWVRREILLMESCKHNLWLNQWKTKGEGGLFVPGEASPFLLGLNSQLTVLVITFVSETQFLIEKSPFNWKGKEAKLWVKKTQQKIPIFPFQLSTALYAILFASDHISFFYVADFLFHSPAPPHPFQHMNVSAVPGMDQKMESFAVIWPYFLIIWCRNIWWEKMKAHTDREI